MENKKIFYIVAGFLVLLGIVLPISEDYVLPNTPTFENVFFNVTNEVTLEPASFRLPGANAADFVVIGAFPTLAFDDVTVEYAYSGVHVPSDYANGTDWQIKIYWAANDDTNDKVTWCVDYAMARAEDSGYINSTPVTLCVDDNSQGNPYQLLETTKINASGANVLRDDNFGFKIYRDPAQDNLSVDALLVEFSVYYTSDRLGETN